MTALDLYKIQQDYLKLQRQLDPQRYSAMLEEDKGPMGPGAGGPMPGPEEFAQMMQKKQAESACMEKMLTTGEADAEVLQGLEIPAEDYEACAGMYWPIIQDVPEKLVLMTFDDATIDHYTTAAPILEKYGGKGNFFVCEMLQRMGGHTGFDDKTAFMTWEQIKELRDRGHEIVNHSLNHNFSCVSCERDLMEQQSRGLEDRCRTAGMDRPYVYGYPGGRCGPASVEMLHDMGYLFARGDLTGVPNPRGGQSFYDPLIDNPLAMPSFNGAPSFSKAQLEAVLDYAKGGRAVILAYHEATFANAMTLEEQAQTIYACGGRCITFRELAQYVDPVKAYRYVQL